MLSKVVENNPKVIKGVIEGYQMCFMDLLRGATLQAPLIGDRKLFSASNVEKLPSPTVLGNRIEGQHTRCSFVVLRTPSMFSPSMTFDNLRRSGNQL